MCKRSNCETISPTEVHRALVKALARHAVNEARHLDVGAFKGEVVVAGSVHSAAAREIALAAARAVPGVTCVRDLIQVRPPASGHTTEG